MSASAPCAYSHSIAATWPPNAAHDIGVLPDVSGVRTSSAAPCAYSHAITATQPSRAALDKGVRPWGVAVRPFSSNHRATSSSISSSSSSSLKSEFVGVRGGEGPSSPTPSPNPSPTPSPTPSPNPSPTPTARGEGEGPSSPSPRGEEPPRRLRPSPSVCPRVAWTTGPGCALRVTSALVCQPPWMRQMSCASNVSKVGRAEVRTQDLDVCVCKEVNRGGQ